MSQCAHSGQGLCFYFSLSVEKPLSYLTKIDMLSVRFNDIHFLLKLTSERCGLAKYTAALDARDLFFCFTRIWNNRGTVFHRSIMLSCLLFSWLIYSDSMVPHSTYTHWKWNVNTEKFLSCLKIHCYLGCQEFSFLFMRIFKLWTKQLPSHNANILLPLVICTLDPETNSYNNPLVRVLCNKSVFVNTLVS